MDNSIAVSGLSVPAFPENQAESPQRVEANKKGSAPVSFSESENQDSEKTKVDTREAEEVVVQLSEMVQNLQRDLLFSVDKHNGNTILKVIDSQTDEVVREIPSEDIRRIRDRMREVTGLLFRDST